jgi:plastocyanin
VHPARAAVAAFVVLAACGGEAPLPARAPTPLDHATTGTIAGEVRLDGDVPAMAKIEFGAFNECATQLRGPVLAGDVLVHDGRVENAFVYVKRGLEERVFAIPSEPVEIDQTGCLFRPRVTGARVGQTIRFVNGDPLLHNVRGKPTASAGWNLSLGRPGSAREVRVDRPEVAVSIRCDLHPWMQSWIGVVDHPYFAVTDREGRYRLDDVPPGDYTVAVWHERLGTQESAVTVASKGTADVTLTLRSTR